MRQHLEIGEFMPIETQEQHGLEVLVQQPVVSHEIPTRSIPTDQDIQAAKARLAEIFDGKDKAEVNARYNRGFNDLYAGRETPDRDFYVSCQPIIDTASFACDKPR